jgi:hypothetical protein
MPTTLQNLFDLHALPALEKQDRLQSLVGDAPATRFDANTGSLTLANDLHLPVQRLGTGAQDQWQWAWASPADIPTDQLAYANRLYEFGERYGIAHLTDPTFPLTGGIDAQYLALIASGVCRAGCFHLLTRPSETLVLLGVTRRLEKLPGWTGAAFVQGFEALAAAYDFHHATALLAYAAAGELDTRTTGGELTITLAEGARVHATLDEAGQVTAIRVID